MAKIALVGDTHFGIKGGNKVFSEYFYSFFENIFFPYCEEHGITDVVQLGDLMDHRTQCNGLVFNDVYDRYFQQFIDRKIHLRQMIGNHDVYYKNTNEVNWIKSFLRFNNSEYIHVVNDAETINIDGVDIDMLPWITEDNYDDIVKFINNSDSPYCLGHLELTGFELVKGHIMQEGMSPKLFKDYAKVFTGHYHIHSEKGNILYTGVPYEQDWGDCDDAKGFWVLDTDTGDYEFILNPNKLFIRINYDDQFDVSSHDFSQYDDRFIKVMVKGRTDDDNYDAFLTRLNSINVVDSTVIDATNTVVENIEVEDFESEDTLSLLNRYVDKNIPEILNKDRINNHIMDAYFEANVIMKDSV